PVTHLDAAYPINCMFTEMPNTTFIYPTSVGLSALAEQYHTDIKNCSCINNSIDITLDMGSETLKIIKDSTMLGKEILIVYPARLTMAKRFHIIAQVAGVIKKYCNKTVGVIFCDFPAADIAPDAYKFIVKDIGFKNGLDKEDILFTSDCGFKDGVKRETVFDLFSLSNLFICPSYSESFGLTVIEAASRGNYIVLNEAVPALEEIGKNIKAYFMRWSARNFGFDSYETYHPDENMYYVNNGIKIIENMENNSVIKAKTLARIRYSNDWIYKNQLKPLLFKNSEPEIYG
ncbi:MAG: glycosyltransferase, partial [Oscillospiraceae bacterium]